MLDPETFTMYGNVAQELANQVEIAFDSEDSLKAVWENRFSALPFDRTDRWNSILRDALKKVWYVEGPAVKSPTTPFDEANILWHLGRFLDFNLYTQVVLNLQPTHLLTYRSSAANQDIEELKAKWDGKSPSPFDAKPKMFKTAATADEQAYNRDLSTLKALKIVSSLTFARSFRVSPMGSTPALTDSENLSMLGIGGDRYLTPPPDYKAYYITWETAPMLLKEFGDNKFGVDGISYLFESKSGGETLNSVLFSRYVARIVITNLPPDVGKAILPRMNSVLFVTNAAPDAVATAWEVVRKCFGPELQLHEDFRPDPAIPAAA